MYYLCVDVYLRGVALWVSFDLQLGFTTCLVHCEGCSMLVAIVIIFWLFDRPAQWKAESASAMYQIPPHPPTSLVWQHILLKFWLTTASKNK